MFGVADVLGVGYVVDGAVAGGVGDAGGGTVGDNVGGYDVGGRAVGLVDGVGVGGVARRSACW